ncbi:MAG: NUDIX domain-containing protein [Chitinophagales bacterium]
MFNIRVYGILIHEEKVLLVEESIRGKRILKFPGGGLEFGEGTIDCLRREFLEELQIELLNIRHFYTTDFFVQSFLDPNDQVISIYYLVDADVATINYSIDETMQFSWIELGEITEEQLVLPIDKIVIKKLKGEM